jgi:hypothetical protein
VHFGLGQRISPDHLIGFQTEDHVLDRKTEKQVTKAMIGRRLSRDEANDFWPSSDKGPPQRPQASDLGHTAAANPRSSPIVSSAAAFCMMYCQLIYNFPSHRTARRNLSMAAAGS